MAEWLKFSEHGMTHFINLDRVHKITYRPPVEEEAAVVDVHFGADSKFTTNEDSSVRAVLDRMGDHVDHN